MTSVKANHVGSSKILKILKGGSKKNQNNKQQINHQQKRQNFSRDKSNNWKTLKYNGVHIATLE